MPSDQTTPALLIGIAGGSAGGKTSLARELTTQLETRWPSCNWTASITLCRTLKTVTSQTLTNRQPWTLIYWKRFLEQLRLNGTASVPKYDFATHTRIGYERLDAAPVVIVEGILTLWHAGVRDLLDFKFTSMHQKNCVFKDDSNATSASEVATPIPLNGNERHGPTDARQVR